MRRLGKKARARHLIILRKRIKRRCRTLRRHRRRRRRVQRFRHWRDTFSWIEAPRFFELETETGRSTVIGFLRRLRDAVLGARDGRVRIDFSQTVRMTAAGTLLFAAELDRIRKLADHRVGCNYPKDAVVAQVLQHVGIFAMLGQKRQCRITADNVRYWQVDTGDQVVGEQAAHAMARYESLFGNRRLYRALTEAMTNCIQHAYEEDRGDGYAHVRNWWVFSQHHDGYLTVAFCDLGIGIPRSLPHRRGFFARVRQVIQDKSWTDNDANRIKAAMAVGASRTAQDYRGKGLMDMRSVLDGLNGRMQIHSNCGLYLYDAGTGEEPCKNFDPTASVQGTIVLWLFPVSE